MMRFLLLSALLLGACATAPHRTSTEDLTAYARKLIGVPYQYGGNSPATGFDCSGFVDYVYNHAVGVRLPRSTRAISKVGRSVEMRELRAGDLVFFNTLHRTFSHVGIYLGGARFIHAPSSGGSVRIEDMREAYWKQHYEGARRISLPG